MKLVESDEDAGDDADKADELDGYVPVAMLFLLHRNQRNSVFVTGLLAE